MTEEKYTVQGYDVYPNGVMRLSCLQKYLQQAAAKDADKCGATYANMLKDGIVFIIVKMQYEITEMPRFDTEFTVKTWSDRIEGISFTRIYEVYIAGRLAATVTGIWALMDINERRLARPKALKYQLEEHMLKERAVIPRRFELEDPIECGKYTVKYSDLDINGHMNNCGYTDVLFNYLPVDRNAMPIKITLIYMNECYENHELQVLYRQDGNVLRANLIDTTTNKTSMESEFIY